LIFKERILVFKISNIFAALGNFYDNVDISRAWKTIWDGSKIVVKECLGCNELQQQKPCLMVIIQCYELTDAGLIAVVTGLKLSERR
jgi:hypothetical protein